MVVAQTGVCRNDKNEDYFCDLNGTENWVSFCGSKKDRWKFNKF